MLLPLALLVPLGALQLAPDRLAEPLVPAWAELIEAEPSSKLVRNVDFRKRLRASGLAWRVRDRTTGIEMLLVPAGTYGRGASPETARPPTNELPRHTVTISAPFDLARYDTQEKEWDFLFDGVPPRKGLTPPVTGRTFADVEAFLRRANAARPEGSSPMRVPTEGGWEYACRAGRTGPHYGCSLAEIAWYAGNAAKQVREAGQRKANDLGFSDMLGNVLEWCSEGFHPAAYERAALPGGRVRGSRGFRRPLQGAHAARRRHPPVRDRGHGVVPHALPRGAREAPLRLPRRLSPLIPAGA